MQVGSWFEVKMYEMGWTMEEISEGWVEMTKPMKMDLKNWIQKKNF
jgi:hypothetical protein